MKELSSADEIVYLFRISFFASVLLFVYGTLFPFHFDLSYASLREARIYLVPYLDLERGRISGLPDIVSNIFLTIPLGCFGYLWMERRAGWRSLFVWSGFALALAFAVEVVQITMPSRITSVTDLLNNGLGALLGAAIGHALSAPMAAFVSLVTRDRARAAIVLLVLVLVAYTLGPFNLTMSVSDIIGGVKSLVHDPWESGTPISHEWIQMALFAVLGGVAGKLLRSRRLYPGLSPALGAALVLALPVLLESGQLFVQSHAPSLRDMSLGALGAGVGLAGGLWCPGLVRPWTGLAILTFAIVTAGLSPYRFVPWEAAPGFEWIPLVEYYNRTTMGALYDAGIGLLNFAVWAALFGATFFVSRWKSTLATIGLATAIEIAQTIVPGRTAGMTDILVAALGGWVGHTMFRVLRREVV